MTVTTTTTTTTTTMTTTTTTTTTTEGEEEEAIPRTRGTPCRSSPARAYRWHRGAHRAKGARRPRTTRRWCDRLFVLQRGRELDRWRHVHPRNVPSGDARPASPLRWGPASRPQRMHVAGAGALVGVCQGPRWPRRVQRTLATAVYRERLLIPLPTAPMDRA